MDKQYVIALGKGAAYVITLSTVAYLFFRILVPLSLGLHSALFIIATPASAIAGIAILLFLGYYMIRDIKKTLGN